MEIISDPLKIARIVEVAKNTETERKRAKAGENEDDENGDEGGLNWEWTESRKKKRELSGAWKCAEPNYMHFNVPLFPVRRAQVQKL